MGLLDIFKKKQNDTSYTNIIPINGGNAFSLDSVNKESYASDIVVQAIRCKANEFKKLLPKHIRETAEKREVIHDNIQWLLENPNEYMTATDFLEKITILLELNKNVYIFPSYHYDTKGNKIFDALYPLMPQSVTIVKDSIGKIFYKFFFQNGYSCVLPCTDIIHWRKDYGVQEYYGGNGMQDAKNVEGAISYYDSLCKSVAKALNSSYQINGILKVNTMLSTDKMDEERQNFVARLQNNESGIMVTDFKTEYVPMNKDVKLIDADTIKFMYENVLRATGCSLAILKGDYTKTQKEAYYEHALEGDIKALGEAFTKVLFTTREKQTGNKILMYPKDINFMTMDEKIRMVQVAMPAGALTKDEFRELFGFAPLPNGEGDKIAQGYNTLIDMNNSGNAEESNSNE